VLGNVAVGCFNGCIQAFHCHSGLLLAPRLRFTKANIELLCLSLSLSSLLHVSWLQLMVMHSAFSHASLLKSSLLHRLLLWLMFSWSGELWLCSSRS